MSFLLWSCLNLNTNKPFLAFTQDLNNCVERLDLENYDKCHELRSPFKKKYRLILIRAPKSASKVSLDATS